MHLPTTLTGTILSLSQYHYTIDIYAVLLQFLLGIVLFILINWIGKHSYSIGYMEISLFSKREEAPALNFLIRTFTPIVYIIISSSILYYFHLDRYVESIYLVNVYYIIIRLCFNLITNRGVLLNWYRQVIYWITIIVISFFTYEKLIRVKTNLLPDFTNISNELWIIVLVFIFHTINRIRFSEDSTIKRKNNYIKSRYQYFKTIFGQDISKLTQSEALDCIVYAILIYEDFNRPKTIRFFEKLLFHVRKRPHTLGVMQVKTNISITDKESVILGTNKIIAKYKAYFIETKSNDIYESSLMYAIINDYNRSLNYYLEICELISIIKQEFYQHSNDTLIKLEESPEEIYLKRFKLEYNFRWHQDTYSEN